MLSNPEFAGFLFFRRFRTTLYDPQFQNKRPCLPKIKVFISFTLEGHKEVPRRSEGHHDRCRVMGFDGGCRHLEGRLTRHGRRHKSVREPSSRVWEATRRVFSGLTRGSRRHRSRYENGDEWAGQKVSPSVDLSELKTIL